MLCTYTNAPFHTHRETKWFRKCMNETRGRERDGNVETGGRATEGWATNESDGGGRLAQCHPVRTWAGAGMGMGEGARRIRMEEEGKQTSILLPWCHLGTGTMKRDTSRGMGREEEGVGNIRGQQSMEVSKMPADRGWVRCRLMKGSVEGFWREKWMILWNCKG